ncbi:MAG: helix-turn-helix domain-containing protein [Actinomycetota bacterium]
MVDLRERRQQLVRDEVRAAAVALMADRGFDGVTVEQIAANTSVSPSTIYRHFGTKEAMVLTPGRPAAVVERVAADTKREATAAIRRAVNRVYGKDERVPAELQLASGNAALSEHVARELADVGDALAAALASRAGRKKPKLDDRARAAATLAAVAVALLDWADAPDTKLTALLDDALSVLSP